MQVKEAMAKTIGIASPTDSIQKVAQIMKAEDAGFVPICEDGALKGVVTDRDIVLRCVAEGRQDMFNQPAERIMTKNPTTIEAGASLEDAAKLMERVEVRRLPVVDNGRLVGILSHGNLVQAAHSEGPADTATLGVTRGA
jgi:CBS domain-containing protein